MKNEKQSVKDVQEKILEIIKYIDKLCRENGIKYFIMGGTALGAVRHGGFIPWDDDLDIFFTPKEYEKFKTIFERNENEKFVLQEWKSVPDYLEYAKVRMNGTTFIEESLKDREDIHHGIFVDIMILHKVPDCALKQKMVYYESKFVTLYGLSQRGWKPKTKMQAVALKMLKYLPSKMITNICYKDIYRYDDSISEKMKFCYWITKAKFKSGLFGYSFFEKAKDIPFEDTVLMGPNRIKEYLSLRYGDYMKLPSEEERKVAIHAMVYDVKKDYREYIGKI